MKLFEAIKYYSASPSKKEQRYAARLLQMTKDIGKEKAEALLSKASSQEKFIGYRPDPDVIDGGDYVIVDSLSE